LKKPPVLILGARSDIGMAVARKFASLGSPIQLAARSVDSLDVEKGNIELRYDVPVSLHEFDALAVETHEAFVGRLTELPEIAVCAVGLMKDQAACEGDTAASVLVMRSNYEGPANILAVLANRFADRGSGTLVGISSVAGERGRASNYVYGSAKAGFTAFLSGLRNRLAGKGVHVVTVLPGFVDTKMTEGMNLPPRLTAQPEEVAEAVVGAIEARRNVVYVRPIWRLIMAIIRMIPEPVFKRTRI
jgi:decaprenylphospho-beta-D-erythro-pentofuranosid-2-ulose 2-reductase